MDQNPVPDEKTNSQSGGVVTSDNIVGQNQPASALDTERSEQPDNFTQAPASTLPSSQANSVSWTASEFIDHHKSAGWYFLLSLIALIIAAIVWFITRDIFSSSFVFIGILLLGVYGAHKPRQLTYAVDDLGITIGHMHHTFSEFRSFSVISEGAFSSIELVPLRRFAMYITVYFDPADEDKIIGVLSTHIPIQEPRNDLIEQLMRQIRF